MTISDRGGVRARLPGKDGKTGRSCRVLVCA